MSGAYVYTPAVWPPLVAAIFLAAISLYAWRRRDVPGGKPFVAMSAVSILYLLGVAFEAAAVAPAGKLSAYKFQFLILLAAVTPVTCFILDYAYPGRWLTRRNLVLLCIPPLLGLLLMLTNDSQLIWRRLEVGADGSVTVDFGPAGAILVAYGVAMLLLYAAVFVWLFIRSPQHRWPVALMLLGQVTSRTLFLLDDANLPVLSPLDLSVFVVVLPWTTYAIALFGFHLLNPLPAAHQTVIEQMHAGMVVFDAKWQVVSLNPAAERIAGIRAGAARGKTWQQVRAQGALLPSLPDDGTQPAEAEIELPEMALGSGAGARHYAPALSALRDFRGLLMGYLLMLRDVTEEMRAREAQQQQRLLLAITQERERLARELHDSLGQTLAAAHLQASSARLLLARGETAQTDECLERLTSMTSDAEADVREYLLGARTGFAPGLPFFALLQEYMERYGRQYGLQVALTVPAQLEARGLEPAAEVQLLRIIQEALSNVRKHACARSVQVTFSLSDGTARIAIADDGRGFDPAPGAAGQGDGYGLRSMRERAEALGGRLEVISQPGHGARVEVYVPVGE
jgi:signal transduction histidine kinase